MNKREKNLLKNTFVLSLGTFLPKLTSIILIPILTGYLTKEEYGTYDLITTLVSLLLPAVTLQIQSAAFRFLINKRKDEKETNILITNILTFTTLVSILSLIILYFLLYKINYFIRFEIIIYFLLDITLISLRQISRGVGDNLGFAINSTVNSFIMLFFTFLGLVIFKLGISGVLIALIISSIISILTLTIKLKILKRISLKYISKIKIKELIKYSWPMVPNNLSNWVLALSDRIVITTVIGIEANAVYAVANKIPNIFKTFQATFINAWQENASLSVKDNDSSKYYSKIFDSIFGILFALMALLIAFSPILFKFLIKGEYGEAYFQMPILCIGIFFSSIASFIGGIYIAHMKTKNVGITTICAAICNLIIDLIFVKKIGIYAGSISTLVSYFILAIYRMQNVKSFQKISYNYFKIIFCSSILVLLSAFIYLKKTIFDILEIIIAVITSIFVNSTIIKSIIENGGIKNVKKNNKENPT